MIATAGCLAALCASAILAIGCGRPNAPADDTREGHVPVPGGRVWYQIVGANKQAVPLLILHGGPGAPHDYLEPLAALANERPVIFYDQLGCGNSDKPDDPSLWTLERFVEELAVVRTTLRLDRVHILGQSWGTMLAVDYLLRNKPAGIVSVILSSPCLSASRWASDTRQYVNKLPSDVRSAIESAEASGDFAAQSYQDAMMAFYRLHVCRSDPWPDCMNRTFQKLGQQVYETMWGPSEFTVSGRLKGYERVDRLGEIRQPTLFTCGRHDEATPEALALYHQQVPGAEMVIFEDASHNHHLEKTPEYLSVVRDFLSRAEKVQGPATR